MSTLMPIYFSTVLFSHVGESWKCTNTRNLWLFWNVLTVEGVTSQTFDHSGLRKIWEEWQNDTISGFLLLDCFFLLFFTFDWKLLLWLQSSDWQSLLKFQESKQEVPQSNSISCLPNGIQTKPTYWAISYLPKNLTVAKQNSRSQHIQFYLVKVRHIII